MPFLSTEHRFILELLRRFLGKVDKISPFPGMDWEKIHTIITNHGLYPIAHYILKQETIAPPKPFERQWAAMRAPRHPVYGPFAAPPLRHGPVGKSKT